MQPSRRLVTRSVVDLQAMMRFLAENNSHPNPFRWTARPAFSCSPIATVGWFSHCGEDLLVLLSIAVQIGVLIT
jgi:hypothetical protein